MKKLFTLMLTTALFLGSSAFAATIYYVQASAAGTNSWDAGYASSGTIVDLSTVNGGAAVSFNAWFTDKSLATPVYSGTAFVSGDQVWIAKGTYYLTGVVTLKGGVSIYGGFAGTVGETVATRAKTTTDKWDFTNVTALDGSVNGTKTYIGITGGSGTNTIIDGITIQNCTNGATNTSGAAAKIAGAGTTLQNCIVTGCTATGTATTGASAGVTLTNGTVKDSYIHHNTSSANGTNSGGISVYGNGCTVSGCKIDNNANTYSTTADGGGMFLYSTTSGVSISNCSFSNNSATRNGGGISSYVTATNASAISISNCTFRSNTAAGSGGGAYLSSSIASNIYNISGCTFTSNSSAVASSSAVGGGAMFLTTCAFNVDKCNFTGNYTTLSSGGAITIPASSSCAISNSKFLGNTAGSTTASSGSAIYCKSSYTANNCLFADNVGTMAINFYTSTAVSTYQNCTFANNLTAAGAAAPIGLLNIGAGPTYPKYVFTNCLFYKVSAFSGQTGPTTTTCASDIALNAITINNITSADFVDASNATVASRNYQLSSTSLAINAGTSLSDATSPVTKDILDVTRPQGGAYDIGTYEYKSPEIVFVTPTAVSKTYGDANFSNTASSSLSTGTVTYSSGNTGVATVNASTGEVTIVTAGQAVITAAITAANTYSAATVSYTLTVAAATPNLAFATPTAVSKVVIDVPFINAATSSNSSGAISYISGNEAVATVNASTGEVTILTAGDAVITASIAAAGNYGASSVSYTLTVSKDVTGLSIQNIVNPIAVAHSQLVSNINGAIQIHNLSGKSVLSTAIKSGESITLPTGMYIVKVISNNDVFVQKVAIK